MTNCQPSRELDATLHEMFTGSVLALKSGMFTDGGIDVPRYTSSIDDAVALIARVLPEASWFFHGHSSVPQAGLVLEDEQRVTLDWTQLGGAPLALISALLLVHEGSDDLSTEAALGAFNALAARSDLRAPLRLQRRLAS